VLCPSYLTCDLLSASILRFFAFALWRRARGKRCPGRRTVLRGHRDVRVHNSRTDYWNRRSNTRARSRTNRAGTEERSTTTTGGHREPSCTPRVHVFFTYAGRRRRARKKRVRRTIFIADTYRATVGRRVSFEPPRTLRGERERERERNKQ